MSHPVQTGLASGFAVTNLNGYRPVQWSLVYVKTSIAGYFFDAILRAEHTTSIRMTEHPVQTGANIVDHAYVMPARLTLEVAMSDAMDAVVPGQFSPPSLSSSILTLAFGTLNTFAGKSRELSSLASGLVTGMLGRASKSANAYDVLVKLQASRLPLTVTTRLKTYQNMLIEYITAPDDYKTKHGLRAIVAMREIMTATVAQAKVPTRPQVASLETNVGTVQPRPIESAPSALYSLEKLVNPGAP